jgi:hypothetical protein
MPRSRLSESSDADSSASLGATTSSDANEACASGAGRPARVQVPDEEKLTQQLISSSDKVESALADLEALVASADGSSSPPVKIMQLEAMHTLEQVKASCSSLMGSAKLSLRRLPLALNKQPSKSSGGGGSSVFDAESLRISSISEATSIAAPAAAPGSVPPGAVPHHHTPRAGGKQPTAGQRDCFRVKRPSSTVLDLSNRRSVRRVVWANVVAVTMHLGLWFVDWSVAPTIDQDVLLQAATTGINASVREAHQLVYQPPYVAFFALRCTVGLCTFATMVLVFGGGNDAFVLHTLARSAQPIMMGLKLLLYLVFTTMIYAVRGQFDVLQLPRFFLAPCVYVSGMGLIILCDANRRAQKLRWACVARSNRTLRARVAALASRCTPLPCVAAPRVAAQRVEPPCVTTPRDAAPRTRVAGRERDAATSRSLWRSRCSTRTLGSSTFSQRSRSSSPTSVPPHSPCRTRCASSTSPSRSA